MKFHCVAEPVRDSGTFGMLMLNPFTLVLLLNDDAEPALIGPPAAIEFADRFTEPEPALIVPGVSVLTSFSVMPMPPAVTVPPKSFAIASMIEPAPACRLVVPVTFAAPDCVMLPVVVMDSPPPMLVEGRLSA